MNGKEAVKLIKTERHYLQNILKDFRPEHGHFKPTEEMRTVGQQIKHITLTTKFYYETVFGSGFTMSFQEYKEEMKKLIGLEDAIKDLDEIHNKAVSLVEDKTEEEMKAPLPSNNPMLGEGTLENVIIRNIDHTAHHRGALTVYLRLLGIKPEIIYA
jgi:uncharacterized damage-inducible protein DinB